MMALPWQQCLRKALSRALRPLQFWLRRQLLVLVDRVTMRIPVKPAPHRVLLIRVDHIGDFVLWLHAARALAEHYRNEGKEATLLANAGWALWAEELGIFDRVLPLEPERYKKDLRYRVHMGGELRRLGFGTAVHAAPTRVPETGDSLVRVSGATQRIGPVLAGGAKTTDCWYTRLIPTGTPWTGELLKNAALASGLLGAPQLAGVADLRGVVKSERLRELALKLPKGPYYVLFPGASHPGRKWPVTGFSELARRIHERTGWAGIVCGGPGDADDAALIVRGAEPLLHSLAGETDLGQLAALIAGAKLLVSNETSAIHIAAAVGVGSVCIVGGGHFGRFVPYEVEERDDRPLPRSAVHRMPCFGCDWMCRFHPLKNQPTPCVEGVTVEAVWEEVEAILRGAEGKLSPFRVLNSRHNPTKDELTPALVGI